MVSDLGGKAAGLGSREWEAVALEIGFWFGGSRDVEVSPDGHRSLQPHGKRLYLSVG